MDSDTCRKGEWFSRHYLLVSPTKVSFPIVYEHRLFYQSVLADFDAAPVEQWLVQRTGEDMSASTRNSYLAAAGAFVNWCIADGRLAVNPFARVVKANEDADCRRTRRALDDAELVQLLDAARRRPLLDAMTIRRGKRKGQAVANVGDTARARLELLRRERALVYKTFLLTGLRRGELASLTVGRLHLEGPVAFLSLDAGDEKNREGSDLALRDDLTADLRDWLAYKLHWLQEEARQTGAPIPARLPADTPFFNVPVALVEILNRDLRLVGIAKPDDRGRTIDVHALRHTFATHLSRGGVAPRTAQAAMRHSTIDLTMNTYTDPRLLDVRGALDPPPLLPLGGGQAEGEAFQATGTERDFRQAVCSLAPTPDNSGSTLSYHGNESNTGVSDLIAVSGDSVNGKGSLSSPDSEPSNCGEWTRTTDLQVMSLASYHCSTPRPVRAALVSESPA
jgi:integrase